MTIDIEALEAAAKAATPGPWVRGRYGGIYPDDESTRGPCIVHARYSDHTSRPNAQANEAFVAANNPKVVLGLLRRLRDAETEAGRAKGEGCACQGCGKRYYDDLIVPDDIWERIKPEGKPEGAGLLCSQCIYIRAANLMADRLKEECEFTDRLVSELNDINGPTHMGEPVLPPKNPTTQEVTALKAHCRELRSALFAAGVEAASVAWRMAERPDIGLADPLRQPLIDIHDAAAEALRGYPAMSLAREQAGSQEPDATEAAKAKAALLLELSREYRDMDVDADVIENLRARAGMELATVGIALQEFEESQS